MTGDGAPTTSPERATSTVVLRSATRADARAMAVLMDIASEGISGWLWSRAAAAGETALQVGERRAARDEGQFSWRHADLLEVGGRVGGMLLGYRQPDPFEVGDLAALPEVVRPAVELEALAPGSWYVNGLAVLEPFRGHGHGSRLLAHGELRARRAGADRLSLIVAEENQAARRLYERFGYRTLARRPIVPFAGLAHRGDWLLMVKPLA